MVSPLQSNSNVLTEATSRVRPHQLVSLVEQYRGEVRVLSLDCFDTVLWRGTATPVDVFYALQRSPTFSAKNFSGRLRCCAEGQARSKQYARTGRGEVELAEIYRAAYPDLTTAEIVAMSRAEIDEEIDLLPSARVRSADSCGESGWVAGGYR